MAAVRFKYFPPSENESGVTFKIPITNGFLFLLMRCLSVCINKGVNYPLNHFFAVGCGTVFGETVPELPSLGLALGVVPLDGFGGLTFFPAIMSLI